MPLRIFDQDTYEKVYQLGLVRLRDALQEWNRRANAIDPPYENDVDWLSKMIKFGQERLDSGAKEIREDVSVRSDQFLRAAALLRIFEKEREITESRARRYPAKVLQAMEDDLAWIRQKANITEGVEPADALWSVIPKPHVAEATMADGNSEPDATWDVFISHATEDKEPFVRELAEALQAEGLRVWYDKFTLKVGDSLRRSIDEGLALSRFGVVVLSPYFFAKKWPQLELDGLVAREIMGRKVILPIWHNINPDEVRRFSPTLADRIAVKSSAGLRIVVVELLRVIAGAEPKEITGVAEVAPLPAMQEDLDEKSRDILKAIADMGDEGFPAEDLAAELGMAVPRMKYHLGILNERDLITLQQEYVDGPPVSRLTQKGMGYLVERGLL